MASATAAASGLGLAGKRVLITGGSAGIGRATALRFAAEGARCVIAARGRERLERVLAEMNHASPAPGGAQQPPPRHHALPTDIQDLSECVRLVHTTIELLGGLDVVVNNGGVGEETQPERVLHGDAWMSMYTMHVINAVAIIREALPQLIANRGVVINVSSELAHVPHPDMMPYCSAKAAQDMMTRSLALKYAPQGVRVVGVAPGVIQTNAFDRLAIHTGLQLRGSSSLPDTASPQERAAAFEAGRAHYASMHPLARVGLPEEIASAIAFLASPTHAAFITGVVLPVDGGFGLTSWFTAPEQQRAQAQAHAGAR